MKLPMGALVGTMVVAMIIGAAAAKLLHDAAPMVAWLAALGLALTLHGYARRVASRPAVGRPLFVLFALCLLAIGYLMMLGPTLVPPPTSQALLSFLARLVALLTVLGLAAAVPVALAFIGIVHHRAELPRLISLGPLLLGWALGIAAFALTLILLGLILWSVPRSWLLIALVAFALVSPAVLLPLTGAVYRFLLSRWQVDASAALVHALDTLYDRTGFRFDRILCLDREFGGGLVAMVILQPGRSTLVMSTSLADAFDAGQLLAVLAHEAAHVRLHHVWRKLAFGAGSAIACIAVAVVAQIVLLPVVPRSLAPVGILVTLLPLAMLRGLYETHVTRRHEAEADEYAVDVAGADALVGALEALRARGVSPLTHNRWTTHGTWERRVAWIRSVESNRPSKPRGLTIT